MLRAAILGALLLCAGQAVAPETFRFRSADVVIRLAPDLPGGRLTLGLGPFGELSWRTHQGPISVEATFLIRPQAPDLPKPEEFRDLRYAFLLRKAPWLLAFGGLAGALLVEGRRRRRAIVVGAAGTTSLALLLVGIAALTFNARALSTPRYRGPIADAPRVIELLREVQRDWAGVQHNINRAVDGLERLHSQVVGAVAAAPADTTRLLLVSDLHNNPIGLLIARELAERFDVDGVLDAGDVTDRGTAIEGELFARFGDLGLPHAIAPGNHEDRQTVARISRVPGVAILSAEGSDVADVAGVRVLGDADPNATTVGSAPAAPDAAAVICERLRVRWIETRTPVLLVHDPAMAECAANEAEAAARALVVAVGHTHAQGYEERGAVIVVNPGTSGANGFKSDVDSPYGFALIDLDPERGTPVSVCLFQFDDPATLRQTTCHLSPPAAGEVGPASTRVRPVTLDDASRL